MAQFSIRSHQFTAALAALALLALATACGDDVGVEPPKTATSSDTSGADTLAGLDAEDTAAGPVADTGPELAPTLDTTGPDVPFVPTACEKNEQCSSGPCLPTPDGSKCAQPCLDKCPDEYACQQTGLSSDVQFVCVHQAPFRCNPCKSDAECDGGKGKKGMCADFGLGGFCLEVCDQKAPCIGADFTCGNATASSVQNFCVPNAKVCPCPDGKSGACAMTNAFGTCKGSYTCGGGKAGACEGPQAATETCNLADDDCDGKTDEGIGDAACDIVNVYGTCKGLGLCVAGKVLCQGSQASAESCNGIDDNCSGITDEGSIDSDGDLQADCVDKDDDNDGVDDGADNCPLTLNSAQTDTDNDKQGDACDGDDDNDKILDGEDNCALAGNATQADNDGDGKGDVCDCDLDGDGAPNTGVGCPSDVTVDNCLTLGNGSQQDNDSDGLGDACDGDIDGDSVLNAADNCPEVANADQANFDKGAYGDACDDDDDDDKILDAVDNCPMAANPTQTDLDSDGSGDECDSDKDGDGVDNIADNCPGTTNADQADINANKIGDACENDFDSDGILNDADNCQWSANPSQLDTDGDAKGDACDCDADGDGVTNPAYACAKPDKADNCAVVVNADQQDLDGDGAGDLCDNDKDGDGDPNASDCAPLDKAISKVAKEACNGKDDDCDGDTDEEDALQCKPYYYDGDSDGAGVTLVKCLCAAADLYSASVAGDCNDQDKAIHPKASEICGNGQDDNCNGSENDENAAECKVWFSDKDGDGFGSATSKCLCTQSGDFTAKVGGDCNDADQAMSPGLSEICKDNKDNNCDKQIDEAGCAGCTTYFKDADGDGYGVDSDKKCLSGAGSGYTAQKAGDCNDGDKAVSPLAKEICNAKDDNCDALTDEQNATGCKTFYIDEDKDGFGTASGSCLCKAVGLNTSVTPTDCNDKDITVNPNKAEVCGNGKDDNCAGGETEENAISCSKFYYDGDKDGYGTTVAKCYCAPLGLYSAPLPGDCSDTDNAMSPGLVEKCQDKKDNDCDKLVDEENCTGCITYYKDVDLDGYGLTADKKCLSAVSLPYSATLSGDCADADQTVKPSALEACNAKDDNCNSQTDETNATGCKSYYTDVDKDGFGTGSAQCLCAAALPVSATKEGDCDDKDATVNPAKPEVCGNGKDDNCVAGETDVGGSGCVNYFSDGDGDGFGIGTAKCTCAPQGNFTAKLGGDCADSEPAINPAQNEKCTDSKDNNCNGQTDEAGCQGCNNFFKDADQDGFGVDADKLCLGVSKYPHTAFIGGDCNDDPAKGGTNVKPGALEICNGLDDNCDGQTDPTGTGGCQNFYPDIDKDGWGAQVSALCLCKASATYTVTKTGDCNDTNLAIQPTATEVCDTIDNNCNNQVDEGVLKSFYKDEDGDGFGGPTSQQACTAPAGFAPAAGDCNDFNKLIYPKAKETCNDIDDDCNSLIDDALVTQTIFKDNDGDKFASFGASSQIKCNVPVGWAVAQDINADAKFDWDCVDSDATIYPGAPDTCGDGKDNDCDGSADKLCYASCGGSWPFQFKFSSSNAAARPFDYDGDGNFEVMATDQFGFAILTSEGIPMYDYSAAVYNFARGTPATADLDTYNTYGAGTQNLEVVTGNGSKARVYKINVDGTVTMTEHATEQVYDATSYLVSDLNFDGAPELIYNTWCDKSAGSKIFRYNIATAKLDFLGKVADPDGVCEYYGGRFLTDLNGDGFSELVVGSGYGGTGGAVSPTLWSGKVFAYKLTNAATATFGDFCAPNGTCAFSTAVAGLNGVQTPTLVRIGANVYAQTAYSATKVEGQANVLEYKYWGWDSTGKALPGSPTTTVVPQLQPTDIDDNGVTENVGAVQDIGLFDVNGDGYPDAVYASGSELRVNLWNPAKNGFVEHVPSRQIISAGTVSVRGAWDMNGDGTLEVTSADSAGKVYCHSLGANTWNKKAVLPPHIPTYLRTNQWDNFEPNSGKDTNADGVPDEVIRVASALTRKGNFYSYLSTAADTDYYQIDAAWGSSICLGSPKGRTYSLKVYSLADKFANATKVAGADGKPDGLMWTGTTSAGGQVCFSGNSVPVPFRYGEYRFIVGVESANGSYSPYWPYWITAAK